MKKQNTGTIPTAPRARCCPAGQGFPAQEAMDGEDEALQLQEQLVSPWGPRTWSSRSQGDEEPLPHRAECSGGAEARGEDQQGRDLSWEGSLSPMRHVWSLAWGLRWFSGWAVMIIQILVHFPLHGCPHCQLHFDASRHQRNLVRLTVAAAEETLGRATKPTDCWSASLGACHPLLSQIHGAAGISWIPSGSP